MSVRKVKESYDRYDPNVEAFFDDNMGVFEYSDMPDLDDLYAANKGLPIEEFIKDAEEHGWPRRDIMMFLYPDNPAAWEPNLLHQYENVHRRNKYMKEGFWDSYLSLSKKIYSVVKSELSGKKHDFSLEDIQMAFDTALEKIQNSSDKFGL